MPLLVLRIPSIFQGFHNPGPCWRIAGPSLSRFPGFGPLGKTKVPFSRRGAPKRQDPRGNSRLWALLLTLNPRHLYINLDQCLVLIESKASSSSFSSHHNPSEPCQSLPRKSLKPGQHYPHPLKRTVSRLKMSGRDQSGGPWISTYYLSSPCFILCRSCKSRIYVLYANH